MSDEKDTTGPTEPTLSDVMSRLDLVMDRLESLEELIHLGGMGAPRAAMTQPLERVPTRTVEAAPEEEADALPSEARDVVRALFAAALNDDREDSHERMEGLTHSDELRGPRSLDHLRAFPWKRLRANAGSYLNDGDPGSFRVAQQHPAAVEEETEQVKLFLQREGASPAPLVLERDPGSGMAWRIRSLSL